MGEQKSRVETLKGFIGDLARPFAIYVTSAAAGMAVVKIAWTMADKSDDFSAAAIYIGAVLTGVAGLYGAKAWENAKTGKAAADVKVAQAAAGPPTPAAGTATITAAPDVAVAATVTAADDDDAGELPPSARITL